MSSTVSFVSLTGDGSLFLSRTMASKEKPHSLVMLQPKLMDLLEPGCLGAGSALPFPSCVISAVRVNSELQGVPLKCTIRRNGAGLKSQDR